MKVIIDVSEESWNIMKSYLPFQSTPVVLSEMTNGKILKYIFGKKIARIMERIAWIHYHSKWWNSLYKVDT